MLENRIYIDCEVYKDYFLLSAMQHDTGKIRHFEMYKGKSLNSSGIMSMMDKYQTISFNGLGYDLLIIFAACTGYDNKYLKKLSDLIIKSGQPSWRIAREQNLNVPTQWDHIDLKDVAHGVASLKIYGGRLHAKKLQDLPIKPDESITPDLYELMRSYCINDLETTKLLCDELRNEIELREQMSDQYKVDLRSKGGAQVAKLVLEKLLSDNGVTVPKGRVSAPKTIKYIDPGFISFKSKILNDVFEKVKTCDFEVGDSGQVRLPHEISKSIEFEGALYKFGIGGLHSQESKQAVVCNDDELLFEKDVASMYPNIILGQTLYPKNLGREFCDVYQGIVESRLAAKKAGDNSTSDSLKLVVNSSFGLFGSKYSFLYSPDLLIQTTITGQLCLLMLIERITETGAKVYSANTDGVVVKCKKGDMYNDVQSVCFDWELDTALILEETRYNAIYSQSVNNYFAICDDGKIKRKGCFAKNSISKNPDVSICYDAVIQHLAKGVSVEDTITGSRDIKGFVIVRNVTGGATWRGEYIGKAVRFYYSKDNFMDNTIFNAKNNYKVPKSEGSRPIMMLTDSFPNDIDYGRYINESKLILKSVGC